MNSGDKAATIVMVSFLLVVAIITCTTIFLTRSISDEDAREFSHLQAAVRDLDNPTAENRAITQIECDNYAAQAARYTRLPQKEAPALARRYVEGCARLEKERRP